MILSAELRKIGEAKQALLNSNSLAAKKERRLVMLEMDEESKLINFFTH